MKPTWSSAPNWANYLAMDQDGVWWWFEREPEPRMSHSGGYWNPDKGGKCDKASGWECTLESRP